MAYNKAKEEKKWRLWKEAEEKQLRKERYHSVFQGKRNHTFRNEGNRHSGFLYEAVETSKS